jgi:hypothetical protein
MTRASEAGNFRNVRNVGKKGLACALSSVYNVGGISIGSVSPADSLQGVKNAVKRLEF